ncbi:MAG: ABC transporter permease [Candidatus Aminicenantes bacterium]|nr:ABC transporter permease [Candidatus Aminicenantes bacterium]
MIKHYLKTAVRNIFRHKGHSLINIFGLAVGMAGCLLILLWVKDELSYDRFFDHAKSMFRVVQTLEYSGRTEYSVSTPGALGPALKEKFPDVVASSRFFNTGWSIQYGEKIFSPLGSLADPGMLMILSLNFIKGGLEDALDDPLSVALTQETAAKIFGEEEPLGKVLKIDNAVDCTVTGVFEKLPRNSSFEFDYIVPFSILRHRGLNIETWKQNPFLETYVLLREGAQAKDFIGKAGGFVQKHDPKSTSRLFLQPVTDIHLHRLHGGGPIIYIYIFSSIAALILLIACINFMNLSTAKAGGRAKEIGMRKVVGGQRWDVIKQFFGESFLLTFTALILALLTVVFLMPVFNRLSGKMLTAEAVFDLSILSLILGMTILTGLLAGSYPALYLSSFRPVQVLKGRLKGNAGKSFRRVLVIVQFTLSIMLIICTSVVYRQLAFVQSKPLGFNKELLLHARMAKGSPEYEPVRNELLRDPRIVGVTAVDSPPSYRGESVSGLTWEGKTSTEEGKMSLRKVDYDFFKTYEMEIFKGRVFSRQVSSDRTKAVIINEAAAGVLGMENPVGKWIRFDGQDLTIIGVVRDFHFRSFYEKIEPLLITLRPKECLYVGVRIMPEDVPGAIALLESLWKRLDPGYEFEYEFLDDRMGRMYRAEQRMSKLLSYFTGLAVIISCLGLLGLASFIAEKRTKEIGIRKALGSTIPAIVVLLSKDFVKWVMLANLFAWPGAFFVMRFWLQRFSYRAGMTLWLFVLSAILSLSVALLTVFYQALKAAAANPIDALRYE